MTANTISSITVTAVGAGYVVGDKLTIAGAALGGFIDAAVPQAEQQRATEVILKVLNGVVWELWQEGCGATESKR